jgi:probable HAF family extracellular repeat protein
MQQPVALNRYRQPLPGSRRLLGQFHPVQQQQARANNPNTRYTIQDLGVFGANPTVPGGPLVVTDSGWISGADVVGSAEHAVLYYGGKTIDVGTPGLGGNSMGYGVDESGVTAGEAEDTAAGLSTTEDSGTKMQDLGVVGNDNYSFGFGINDAGEIVGLSANADFSVIRAFIRQNNTLVDLNTLVTGNNSLYLLTACFVNSGGQITGIALDAAGQEHAYLATPVPSAAASASAVRKPIALPAWVTSQFRLAARARL